MRTHFTCFAICLLTGLSMLSTGLFANGMTISKGGKPMAAIVLAADASQTEKHAAQELASFLEQVTGGTFEIIERPRANESDICVGQGAAKAVYSKFSTDGLGTEGLIIRTVGKNLILAGGEPRGTLYAVYTFLEDYVGCRWWTPQASLIPKKRNLTIGNLNRRFVPPFEHRDIMILPNTKDPDWSVRNKCVGEMHGFRNLDIMPERGGCRKAYPTGHTYFSVLPPGKFFGDHPEWYSLINGKRVAAPSDHASLCLTSEEMQQAFAENLKQMIHEGPSFYPAQYVNREADPLMFVSLRPPDDSGYPCRCQCQNCVAMEKAEGSPAGLTLRFVNEMAEAIRSDFPGKTVTMNAYHYNQKPPKITRPASNVVVYFEPIDASFSRPLTDPRNKKWNDDLQGWLKICNRVYLFDFPDNISYELIPHPNLRVLATNIKNWAASGVKGYFGDGTPDLDVTGGTEMAELRAWLVAKLLWDPSQDPDQLIKEFTDGYYGPAGKRIVAYLDVMQKAVDVSGDWLGLSSPPDAHFLSIETLVNGWAQLKAAETAVRDNPVLLSRVKVAQLPEMFVFLVRWNQLQDDASCRGIEWPLPASRDDAYRAFMEIVHANGISPSAQSLALLAKAGT